jgi:hypothetical protein
MTWRDWGDAGQPSSERVDLIAHCVPKKTLLGEACFLVLVQFATLEESPALCEHGPVGWDEHWSMLDFCWES